MHNFKEWLSACVVEGLINDNVKRQVISRLNDYLKSVRENPRIAELNNLERMIPGLSLQDKQLAEIFRKTILANKVTKDDNDDKVIQKTMKMISIFLEYLEKKFGDAVETGDKERGMPPKAANVQDRQRQT